MQPGESQRARQGGQERSSSCLTAMAQAAVAERLAPGMHAIDATVGNGHDTLFLARQVGATGQVYGFDLQACALAAASARLLAAGVADRVRLIHAGHETMAERLPARLRGGVQAIMFNLGYLPGSDRQCITRAVSSLQALRQALEWLAPGGLLTVLAYRGHAGGAEEADAVARWLQGLEPSLYQVGQQYGDAARGTGPELGLVYRRPNR
ncbi:MAG: 16S rRNA (cytosine(1402)-N(4))-methyltransferase [Gammaproteobacteria bacterium]|nr:16S rRNA (cytosine(1402)-N(4))-methyltransferase [Gammaproteobacteria bacterium]